MNTTISRFLTIAVVLAMPLRASAQDLAPDVLAKTVTDEVIAVLRADKEIQAGNTKKVLDLVEAKILPHFDFTRMTRLAVGAPWRQATSMQQKSHQRVSRPAAQHVHQCLHTVSKSNDRVPAAQGAARR